MSLPVTEVERELLHTRRVRYEGYKRADGLWDIEAHLTDVKNHDYKLKTGVRRAGQPIHDMWLRITVDRIQQEVAQEYGVSVEGLKSKKRTKTLTVPRQVAMYLCRQHTDLPLVEIGQAFGGRDHTTVIHACDKVENEIREDRTIRVRVEQLRERIAS